MKSRDQAAPTLTRRDLALGAATLAGAAALGIRPVAAQGAACTVGTWGGDYQNLLEANIVKPLLEPKGVKVEWDVASQVPRKNKILAERRLAKGTMDIACLSDIDMYDISLSGALETLDEAKVPNLKHAVANLRHPYSVPHIYSGFVLVYNPNQAQPKGFADMWDEKYRGKVGFVDILFTQNYMAATLAAGGNLSDFEPGKKKLLELKKLGVRVLPTNEAMAQALQSGEVWMVPMWRARAIQWQNAGIPVTDVVPKEGAVPILFEFGVPKNAPNKEGAYAFLNASLEPQAQVGFAQKMGYAPTVSTAELPPELAKKLAFTPDELKHFLNPDYAYVSKEYNNLKQWWDREFLA
jgi:putative spermidine/putrescine transport system substrate-binding protein